MIFPILARVRWRSLQWLLPFILIVFIVNSIQYTHGAPQSQSRFSGPQRQQNPSGSRAGSFRVIPDDDEFDDFEDIIISNARQRGFNIRNGQTSGTSTSFGVPLSSSQHGVRQETIDAARAHFSAPTRAARPNRRHESNQGSSVSFGVPLGATRSGVQGSSQPSNAHFGIPLSATRSGSGAQETSQASNAHFGVPLSATHLGGRQDTAQTGSSHIDVASRTKSHFSAPTHRSKLHSGRFFVTRDDDNVSFENIDNSVEILSLGRRFHPEGIPKRSDVTLSNVPPSSVRTVISNPFIFTSDVASVARDISLEDDDDDTFIVLSPMVKAYNPSEHNERLSLSNDFLSQYNYVDVQGTTNWGYKTDDQYQEHQVHNTGTMQGKFGWTSPGGSQVNIKYIADEGGYRVLSSSGIYTKDDDDVLHLKKLHLAEHEKARANHQSIKEERRKGGSIGVPLPTEFGDTRFSIPSPGSGGLVIIPDDDDFPLVPGRASGPPTDTGVGVPLPTLDNTPIQPELDVGVFIDSSAGVPLPTTTQEGSAGFGIPLPDPTTNLAADFPSHGSGQGFGVPLHDSSVNQIGVPLSGSTFNNELTKPFAPSETQGFGVPLPDPTIPVSADTPTLQSSGQEFGVPLSDPTASFGVGQPSNLHIDQGVGVSLPDSTLSGDQGTGAVSAIPTHSSGSILDHSFGVPLPDPTHTLGPQRGEAAPSDSTFISGFSPTLDHTVGVPLSDPTHTFGSQDTSLSSAGQAAGVSIPDLAAGTGSAKPVEQGGVIFMPDFTLSGAQGVPLPDSTPTFGFGESAISPANEGFGVPLLDPSLGFESGQPSTSGVSLSGTPETFGTSEPASTVPGQELKVTLLDSQGTFDTTAPVNQPGVPLFDSTFSAASPFSETARHPSETHAAEQEFGIPLINPTDLFGLSPMSQGEQTFSSPSVGSPVSDTANFPAETTFPVQDFGVPLTIIPMDITDSAPLTPSDPSTAFEPISPTENEKLGNFAPETTVTVADSQPTSFGIPLFPDDTSRPVFSPTEITGTHPIASQDLFGVPLFSHTLQPTSDVGADSPAVTENEISNLGVFLDQGVPLSKEPSIKTPSPTLVDRTDIQNQEVPTPGIEQPFGVPLDFNPFAPNAEITPGQSGNFFLFPDNNFAGLPQGTGVTLGEGSLNTLQRVDEPTQSGQSVGGQSVPGIPLSSAIFTGGDLLQGPPVEQLDPSLVNDDISLSTKGLDPCLNSKIHPTLLPPECLTRKTETVEPSQNIGKSLLSSSSKSEPSQDSFIVVVNSDIFH